MSFPPPVARQFPTYQVARRRKQQALIVPVVFVVLGAIGTLLGMIVLLERPLLLSVIAVTTFTVVLLLGVWFLTWLDRWEPEPPLFVVGAFLWGAGVSALLSGIVNTVVLVATQDRTATAMFSAPLIEESTKGLFLVAVLLTTRRGRAEFNSLTDAIVYGGMVGLGFAWIEHISYALGPETLDESLQVILVRLIMTSYLHPLLTVIVSIGIWKGISTRGPMRLGWPVLAWCAAVVLHFLHNGSLELFGPIGLLVVAAIELATFISLIVVGVKSRRRERDTVAGQLPALVHFGWVTPVEAGWLADLQARRSMLSRAGAEKPLLSDFIQNTTELALLRARLDADHGGQHQPELLDLHRELVELVVTQRPQVAQVLGAGSGWTPMGPQPGQAWGAPSHQQPW